MTNTRQTLFERADDAIANLWFQMYQIGNRRLQEEIEEVADLFDESNDGRARCAAIERAHEVFVRAHAEYTPETQRRTGHSLVVCPHCVSGDHMPADRVSNGSDTVTLLVLGTGA